MSDKPIRVQRKRTLGWKMPENTVYVGRPSRWGNPIMIFEGHSAWLVVRGDTNLSVQLTKLRAASRAVDFFRHYVDMMTTSEREDWLSPLRGKNLACWCKIGEPCHADVLLELANKE